MIKWYIAMALISYLIGSISFSVIFTKRFAGFDVRERGSKNAGSTNVLRTAGPVPAILTLVCDLLKGVGAVLLGLLLGNMLGAEVCPDGSKAILCQVAAVFAMVGHTFPIFFKFKGGKGVATGIGALLVLNWEVGLICLIFGLVLIALTRMVSVGSMAGAILFPIICIFIRENFIVNDNFFSYIIFGTILAVIILFNHRANIRRLKLGQENILSFKHKNEPTGAYSSTPTEAALRREEAAAQEANKEVNSEENK